MCLAVTFKFKHNHLYRISTLELEGPLETVWCDPFSPMRKLSLDGALDGACWSLQSNLHRGGSAASWPVFLSGTGLPGEVFPKLKSFEYNLHYFCHVQTHFTLNQLIFFYINLFHKKTIWKQQSI